MLKTHPFQFEILVAGFSHLLWLTLLAYFILGLPPNQIIDFLIKVEAGTAVILVALIGGVSFFLGVLAEHILVWVSYLKMNKNGRKKKIDFYCDQSCLVWGAKSFFRSMAFAIAGIIILLLLLDKSQSCKYFWTIVIIGLLIESATIISWLFWKHIGRKIEKYE